MNATMSHPGTYVLATGSGAAGRLDLLHRVFSPASRDALLEAGLRPGMAVADFGCGTGATTRLLASMAGRTGTITGIDLNEPQLAQAQAACCREGFTNTHFVCADAACTRLPGNHFDFAYCRFLLMHLPDPEACLSEMWRVIKPGGTILVEDGDLATVGSVPASALDEFARLFARLGVIRGVDYSIERRLRHLVWEAGFAEIDMRVHQPAERGGVIGRLIRWTLEEAGPSLIEEGLITPDQFERLLSRMNSAAADPGILAMAPRVSQVWGRKRVF